MQDQSFTVETTFTVRFAGTPNSEVFASRGGETTPEKTKPKTPFSVTVPEEASANARGGETKPEKTKPKTPFNVKVEEETEPTSSIDKASDDRIPHKAGPFPSEDQE